MRSTFTSIEKFYQADHYTGNPWCVAWGSAAFLRPRSYDSRRFPLSRADDGQLGSNPPRASQHDVGWIARRTIFPLSGRWEGFSLDSPFIERANQKLTVYRG